MDDCRKAFEEWAEHEPHINLRKDEKGFYFDLTAHFAWLSWQAAWTSRPCGELVPRGPFSTHPAWNIFPVGTKAHAIMGAYWVKTERGWKWFSGATFPTPGADVARIELPDPVVEVLSEKELANLLLDQWKTMSPSDPEICMAQAKAIVTHLLTHTHPDMGAVVEAIGRVEIAMEIMGNKLDGTDMASDMSEEDLEEINKGFLALPTLAALKAGGGVL